MCREMSISRPSGQGFVQTVFFILWQILCCCTERMLCMRNRWLIALAAIGIHISIGSVYAWSVLTKPIMNEMGITLKETTWTFSLAILFLGLSAGFLAALWKRWALRKAVCWPPCFLALGCWAQPGLLRKAA